MAEAGATPVQEIAFTLANAREYVRAAMPPALPSTSSRPGCRSSSWPARRLLEEIAKFRAARRLWAHIMRDEFGAQDPKSQMLRFHTQTAGVQLTAQQPEVNLARVTLQALAAVLGGTQSLHTNSYDEAIALPTQKAATLALRTQQVLAFETDLTATVDPLAGSYAIESMTDDARGQARELMDLVARSAARSRRSSRVSRKQRSSGPHTRSPARSTRANAKSLASTPSSARKKSPTSRCGLTRRSSSEQAARLSDLRAAARFGGGQPAAG